MAQPPPLRRSGAAIAGGRIENLIAIQRSLASTLERSLSLAAAVENAGPRLEEIYHGLAELEVSARPARVPREALAMARRSIGRAVSPGSDVLKVFDALHGLEPTLLADPLADLPGYLAVFKRLEEALCLLKENCGLAILCLEDGVEFLNDSSLADGRSLARFQASMDFLKKSQSPLHGGLLDAALERLEIAFRLLLADNSIPLAMPLPSSQHRNAMREGKELQRAISPPPIPLPVIRNLIAILERTSANGRLERCSEIYVEVRASTAQAAIRDLSRDYLGVSGPGGFNDVRRLEALIVDWKKHLKFAVKHIFEEEYKLCREIFSPFGHRDLWNSFFAEIATKGGLLPLLQFGTKITKCTGDDPEKLLMLVEMFGFFSRLRLDFSRLFGMKPCAEIQNVTRGLVKSIVNGACKIFRELQIQAELPRQKAELPRQKAPPSDGSVPEIVASLLDCCNRLLGDEHRPFLSEVLAIHRSWRGESFHEGLLTEAIGGLIGSLERNLEAWSKTYEDPVLSYIFLINSHRHFYKQLKSTKLGDLLGERRVREHDDSTNYYCLLYLSETWAGLPRLLCGRGLVLISRGRAAAKNLIKKRYRAFDEALGEICRKQAGWLIGDQDLREKVCKLAVQTVVPVYRSFMQSYGPLVERDSTAGKYVKHTAESLENLIRSVFYLKPRLTEKSQHLLL